MFKPMEYFLDIENFKRLIDQAPKPYSLQIELTIICVDMVKAWSPYYWAGLALPLHVGEPIREKMTAIIQEIESSQSNLIPLYNEDFTELMEFAYYNIMFLREDLIDPDKEVNTNDDAEKWQQLMSAVRRFQILLYTSEGRVILNSISARDNNLRGDCLTGSFLNKGTDFTTNSLQNLTQNHEH